MSALESWLKSAKYLPPALRDFHDQNDVFRTMHERIKEDPASFIKRPDWIAGQCYVIDTFLWFMARRGYTLQRSRAKLPFRDLHSDVAETLEIESRQLSEIFNQAPPTTNAARAAN